MAQLINSLSIDSKVGVFSLPFGKCGTPAATAAKTVSTDGDFVLENGAAVIV